jgi:hypothetical protein
MTSLGMCSLFYSSIAQPIEEEPVEASSSSSLSSTTSSNHNQQQSPSSPIAISTSPRQLNRSVSLMTHPRMTLQRLLFGMHMKTKRCLAEEAESGDETCVGSWIQEGCDPNELDNYGYTPLLNAASLGRLNAVSELISNGADVNKVGPFGYTPLHAAAQNGHREIVALLLSSGANLNAQNDDMDTPMHLALLAYRIEIVYMLVSHGGNVRIKGYGKKDCIECAKELRLFDLAERLHGYSTTELASHTQSAPVMSMN